MSGIVYLAATMESFQFFRLASEEEKFNNKKSEAEAQLAEYVFYS